jgi:hypothetical protein
MNVITREEHLSTADLAGMTSDQKKNEQLLEAPAATNAPLFPEDVASDFRSRWNRIQTDFVDEPRNAVQQADELVAQAIKRLSESFAQERSRLEQQWDQGDEVSTEDLRITLQTYRSFFQRLLAI